ncbi:Arylsulfatase [Pontiella desulfatans]|uniref:Arylsulfatase n=1 Tax=Pontiella desulfatans TaxID=2750659 RepID=A0A6C2U014_PONDE|nr:sulfatase [Pontiella desulfatans]SPS73747.1 sulfatase S1_14 [Kiritimatiellales bacterium]VGO13159.1 Arylsulfatase [Pontiella desulfatans]
MRAFLKVSIAMAIVGHVSIFAEGQPNFIIIYADDMGYGDLGCYGAEGYETPELDRMAKQGIRFTDFSTSSSVCTPSRAGLLTGRFAQRWGHDNKVYFPHSKGGMPPSEITIAELLKEKGYQTALIGKWHLGHRAKFLPTAQGFDLYYGIPYSNDMWQAPETPLADNIVFNEGMTRENYLEGGKKKYHNQVPLMAGTEVIEWPVDQATLTKRYTEKAQAFITVNKEQPFFLYLAHAMPHVPLYATEEFKGKTERGLYGDVIEELDWSVGQILNTLKKNGLDKNTLVIFTSDNGPYLGGKEHGGSSGPLRDGKFTAYEGGCRVPCIAWQPGTVPAGVECDVQTSTLDLFPTFAALADVAVPSDRPIDGLDIRSLLKGDFKNIPERDWYLYRGQAIRVGDWKYVYDKKRDQLFNLAEDVGEKKNLAKQYPEKTEALAKRLAEVQSELSGTK